MRTKFLHILLAVLILTVALTVMVACQAPEQSLEGLYVVTFKFNGGILYTGAANVFDQIQHAYKPNEKNNSLVIDISQKYDFVRTGYVFEGWYTKDGSESGDWGDKWNFNSDRVTGDITLYAKWESEIVYSYTLHYVDEEGNAHPFGTYRVEAGDKFADSRNYAFNTLSNSTYNRTYMRDGFYQDKELTTPWNADYTHPGGDESKDVAVYVRSIPGVWKLVYDFNDLKDAGDANIWLMNDIDCGGAVLTLGDSSTKNYNSTLQGNGHEITDFTVGNIGSGISNKFAIFNTLGENAKLIDVHFTKVHFAITAVRGASSVTVASLAITSNIVEKKADGSEGGCIRNVSVTGTYTADFSQLTSNVQTSATEALERLSSGKAFSTDSTTVDLKTFTANIVKQD